MCHRVYTLLPKQLYLQMFIAMSHWSGSRPLDSATLSILDPHQDSSWISCCCPVPWRSCSFGSIVPTLSHAPTVHRWGRCWAVPLTLTSPIPPLFIVLQLLLVSFSPICPPHTCILEWLLLQMGHTAGRPPLHSLMAGGPLGVLCLSAPCGMA